MAIGAVIAGANSVGAVVIDGANFPDGTSGTYSIVDSGVTYTFNAEVVPVDGTVDALFRLKNFNGFIGVGIDSEGALDRTPDEIDAGVNSPYEVLSGSWTLPQIIQYFEVAFLYDGPEFDDVQEIALLTVYDAGGNILSFGRLYTQFDSVSQGLTAFWQVGVGPSVAATNISPALSNTGGVWRVNSPFGDLATSRADFAAVPGANGNGAGTNQSDYSLRRLSVIPEPATVALLGTGLVGLGVMLRRRRDA